MIFLGYIAILSKQSDLRRLFQYHGAEHQVISTYEAGLQLTVENAKRFSRLHPRCGTSFLLVVMVVAIFVFAPIGLPDWYILLAVPDRRRPAGRGPVVRADQVRRAQPRSRAGSRLIIWPGMQLQKLTTREPDDDQIEVAIVALEAVLAVEDPRAASDEERVGVEVAA